MTPRHRCGAPLILASGEPGNAHVLDGTRIALQVGPREVELGAGDVIVQGGSDHTWVRRWQQPCLRGLVVVAAGR